jgi:hypothetical protein
VVNEEAVVTADCRRCEAVYLLPQGAQAGLCPFCGGDLAPFAGGGEQPSFREPPELVVSFATPQERLAAQLAAFARSTWFAPADLSATALRRRLRRLYWPMWLVDAETEAQWGAEAGFDYQVVSHRERYDNGGWQTQEVREGRIRWEPRVGRLERTYHNLPAPALEDQARLQRRLGEYDLEAAQAHCPELTAEVPVRLPDRPPHDAWPDAEPAVYSAAMAECRRAAKADHIRNFHWSPTYASRNWTLLLLPLWATFYRDDEGELHPILIHGQTGRLSGRRRSSLKRARRFSFPLAVIAAVFLALSLVAAIAGSLRPELVPLAATGLLAAVITGFLAPLPLLIAWNFNRREENC